MEMLDLFWVFFWLAALGIVLVFIAALVQDRRLDKRNHIDEHETNPGATAPGLPHNRRRK
jgi:hypothetical protein